MNAKTLKIVFGEATMSPCSETPRSAESIREENEEKRRTQLQNFPGRNRDRDGNKALYNTIMSQFGQILLNGKTQEEGIKTILTEDCEIFLFNFAHTPVEYAFRHEGFAKLFENKRIVRREVKETNFSLKKTTGFQIYDCELVDERKGSHIFQFSSEVFSFRGDKISKYRASFGYMPITYDPPSLFVPTKRERALAKIRELNYAWADQPDFERIASLLHESTEYKLWRWKDKKCFVFDKKNFAFEFKKSLEEDFVIISIVPYGISCEAQYIVGSYVFHLESRDISQKFIWVSNCLFTFDQDLNIKKISQQGELHLESEIVIPFQAHSQEKLSNKLLQMRNREPHTKKDLSIFDTEVLNFSFDIVIFGFQYSPFTGHIKGLSEFNVLEQVLYNTDQTIEKRGVVDYFDDIDDPCYDSFIAITSSLGRMNKEECPYHGKSINFHNVGKFSFENGKLAKIFFFTSVIPDPIPSPYDDMTFTDINIRPKSEFIEPNE